jgi:hypothetical protein
MSSDPFTQHAKRRALGAVPAETTIRVSVVSRAAGHGASMREGPTARGVNVGLSEKVPELVASVNDAEGVAVRISQDHVISVVLVVPRGPARTARD